MTSIPMNQSPEDQFLHRLQDMEKKQKEQARQMKECKAKPSAYGMRMTSCWPRLTKVLIFEKTCEIAATMRGRSPAIKGRGSLLLTCQYPHER